MPKRSANSDDAEYQPSSSRSPKKTRTPETPRRRRIFKKTALDASEDQGNPEAFTTPKKKRSKERLEEPDSLPQRNAVLEAEEILAQYSPGTKRNVKVSDLRRLQATHEERRQEALMKVEKQKQIAEERRKEIFSRLEGLGYSKTIIERDGYDQLKARTRWVQMVEEPQELTEQEWDKVRNDLCVILDRRKETARAIRARTGSSAASSPVRPKSSPVHPAKAAHPSLHQSVARKISSIGIIASGKRGLQDEVDEPAADDNGSQDPLPSLKLGDGSGTTSEI